jgi:hypothetical protein
VSWASPVDSLEGTPSASCDEPRAEFSMLYCTEAKKTALDRWQIHEPSTK